MSVSRRGAKITSNKKRNLAILMLFSVVEFIFSIFIFISLSANLWHPEKMEAATGISKILSYQGRLTDSSGNPLGGTGTNYCFRFSVYDNATVGSGSKLCIS